MVPEQWQFLYALNPMSGVIEGFRWALLGTNPPEAMILVSVGAVILLLVGGLFYFKSMEQYYADVV
jgi:lipopolysaccharide transport system permease protein